MVRRWGGWLIADSPGTVPAPVALEDLLARLDGPQPDSARPAAPVEPSQVIAPVWALAGVLGSDGWHTEDPSGEALVLDAADLRLLDGLVAPGPADALLAATGSDPEVLARLVAAGKVRTLAPPSEPDGRPPEALAAHGDRNRSLSTTGDPRHPDDADRPGRIPVYALVHERHGVPLGLGMVTAAARAHDGGRLTETFEIRRPELLAGILDDVEQRTGPAVLLVSDVIWTIADNLRAAAEVVERNPEVIVVHGGPSAPRYEEDMRQFLADHADVAHVVVRGEGERTLGDLLGALGAAGGRWDEVDLAGVAGIGFNDPKTGALVRTADRPRETNLDDLPSPYLTGEFDHFTIDRHIQPFALETNRGCPYECAFCDWGSATNSRLRFFAPDRVEAEVAWLAERGAFSVFVADANFGLSKRDVQTARHLAEARIRLGAFEHVFWTAAKNTTKHLVDILNVFRSGGVMTDLAIALQTTDERTLEIIGRSNISTDRLLDLARLLRQAAMPVRAELMLGLPGQTVEAFAADLQLMFDEEMAPLVWETLVLPNAPMNDPDYRERWSIRVDDRGVVTETSTADVDDRQRMLLLRRTFLATDVYGTMRHVMRWLQHDLGIPALQVVADLCDAAAQEPERNLAVTWLVEGFDLHPLPPQGWRAFYEDIRAFVADRYGVDPQDSALRCVLEVQRALMPWPGRIYPDTIVLDHDYVDYHLDVMAPLYGRQDGPRQVAPLRSRPPGVLEVRGDPADLGLGGMDLVGHPRQEFSHARYNFVYTTANELDSPLVRLLPEVPRRFDPARIEALVLERMARAGVELEMTDGPEGGWKPKTDPALDLEDRPPTLVAATIRRKHAS